MRRHPRIAVILRQRLLFVLEASDDGRERHVVQPRLATMVTSEDDMLADFDLTGQSVLVTGGTGSVGRRFIETILLGCAPMRVVVYSRDELKQFEMQQSEPFATHSGRLRYFIGDVRDEPRLRRALEGIDVVVHAAALKQVPATEYNPFEAVKTNILGAQNVIDAAMSTGVSRVVALSTDKAAAPINLYGATKLASDKLFVAANNHRGHRDIRFSVVRYGNVIGSRGSVVPFFKSRASSEEIPITDERMTRFNITVQQAVTFVLECLGRMWGGEIFVPKIPSYRILDLVAAVAPGASTKIIGVRPGEKVHEEMITVDDALMTIEFDDYYVITPAFHPWDAEEFRLTSGATPGTWCEFGFCYGSRTNERFLSVSELEQLVDQET